MFNKSQTSVPNDLRELNSDELALVAGGLDLTGIEPSPNARDHGARSGDGLSTSTAAAIDLWFFYNYILTPPPPPTYPNPSAPSGGSSGGASGGNPQTIDVPLESEDAK